MVRSILRRLRRHLGVELCVLFACPTAAGPATRGDGVHCRVVPAVELLRHCADGQLELSRGFVEAAAIRGDLCIGAFEGTGLAGYAWISFRRAPHCPGVDVGFTAHAGYLYKLFVRPDARGRRIAGALYRQAGETCAAQGRTRLLAMAHADNRPSIAAARRAGARRIGYASFVRSFLGIVNLRTAAVRRHGLAFGRSGET